jgi:hypothetical protein
MEGDAAVVRNGQTGLIRMGLAKKLEGNPAHPISQGALCARGQAAVQVTYHPDRLTHPLHRTGPRGSGQFEAVSWDDAIAQLVSQLDGLAASNNQRALAFLKGPGAGQRGDLIARFLDRFGAPSAISFELFNYDVLRRANLLSFGREQLPTFDLARSGYVISFGADFLGTWNSPWRSRRATARCGRGRKACVAPLCRWSRACRRAPMPMNGCRRGRAAKACWRSALHVCSLPTFAPPTPRGERRLDRRLELGPVRLRLPTWRSGPAWPPFASNAWRAHRWSSSDRRRHHRRRTAGSNQRSVRGARGQRAERAARKCRRARRGLVHAAARLAGRLDAIEP